MFVGNCMFAFMLLGLLAMGVGLVLLWNRLHLLESRLEAQQKSLAKVDLLLRQRPGENAPAQPGAQPASSPVASPPAGAPRTGSVSDAIAASRSQRPAAAPVPPIAASTPSPAKPASPVPDAPRAGATMEEKLGSKAFVWIGGAAMVLAGIFFVKYSFDNNLLSPATRLVLGAIFGLGLIGTAQFMQQRSRRIASALAGAGVADLYACLLAATTYYKLIDPTTAFALMVAITGGAILLSLHHGQGVAILGLVGGFITPGLLGGEHHSQVVLLSYLLLLQAALLLVSRKRGWLLSPGLTMLAGIAWALLLLVKGSGRDLTLLGAFMLLSSMAYVLATMGQAGLALIGGEKGPFRWLNPVFLSLRAVNVVSLLMAFMVFKGGFDAMDLAMLGLLGAGLMVFARVRSHYAGLAWLAGGLTVGTILLMGSSGKSVEVDASVAAVWVAMGLCLLYALGSYGLMWGSGRESRWATASGAAGILFFWAMWVGPGDVIRPASLSWWMIALLASAAYVALSLPLWLMRASKPACDLPTGIMLATACALGASSAYLGLGSHLWFLPVWAGIAMLAGGLVRWRKMSLLAEVAVILAWLTGIWLLLVGPLQIEAGDRLLPNNLLLNYGLCTLGIGAAAWLVGAVQSARQSGLILRFIALLMAWFCVFWQVRHGFHREDVLAVHIDLWEWATLANVSLLYAMAMVVWDRHRPAWPQRAVAGLMVAISGLAIVAGTMMIANPLWTTQHVGPWPVLNGLLFIYGLPAVLIAILGRLAGQYGQLIVRYAAGTACLVLVFVLVSLEVRQGYVGSNLHGPRPGMAEMYTYSLAWIVLGIILIVLGVRYASKGLRYASLVVMLAAIVKVFLIDAAQLQNLYRVLSLLGLGVSLMALGYVYQRFVFGRRDRGEVE